MKPGYKQTDVGLIPADWELKSMDELTNLMTNGFVGIATNEYSEQDDSVLYIQGYNVKENGFNFTGIKRVNKDFHERHMKSCLRAGDLLTIQTGDIGVTTMVTPELAGSNCHALVISRFNRRFSDPLFYSYYFNSEVGRKKLKEIETGSTMKHLNVGDMKQVNVVVPPLLEQTAIAKALFEIDQLLDSLDRLIAKKRDLKQAAMQQLLTGQTRLPGFSGDWVSMQLGEMVDPSDRWGFTGGPFGSNLKSSDYTDDGVRIIQLQNIGDGVFLDEYKIFTSEKKADELKSCNIYPGEIILSKMGDPVARACIIPATHQRYLMCSDGIRLALDNRRFCNYFIFSIINFSEFREKAANAGTGSTRKRIGLTELRRLEIKCPSIEEQLAISNILFDLDAELISLEEKRNKTVDLKQGMMQELLTGKTRLV